MFASGHRVMQNIKLGAALAYEITLFVMTREHDTLNRKKDDS